MNHGNLNGIGHHMMKEIIILLLGEEEGISLLFILLQGLLIEPIQGRERSVETTRSDDLRHMAEEESA
jgi:hypothetical protein